MTRFVLLIMVLATAVIFQSAVLMANAHQMSFPFAFRFVPFKFPKRGDGQLDWSSWTMLKAGPYALRPLASLNSGGDVSGQEDFYAPESERSDNAKSSLTSPRNLGKSVVELHDRNFRIGWLNCSMYLNVR